jgi:hypothetical protein
MAGINQVEFDQIFIDWYCPVRNSVYYKTGNMQEAEDITQEAFLKIWERRDIVNIQTIGPLLFKISRNLFLNQTEHRKVTLKFITDYQEKQFSDSPDFLLEMTDFDQIINLSDTITNEGAVQTIEYQDFYIDSIKVDLSATLKNLGKDTSGNWVIEKTYIQTISKEDEIAVRKNTETQVWVSGFETSDKSDDVYYLSGSGSIVINDTASYTKTITSPLLYDASCGYIISGTVELNRNGNVTTIDFGDGTCDDKAIVTTNGTTEEINLHSNKFNHGDHFNNHCPGFGEKHKGRHGH